MSYTTKGKTDALFGVSIPQAVFDDLLGAVKLYIDKYCGKTFEAASETRYYDGNGKSVLSVDAFVGSPAVSILDIDGNVDSTLTEGQASDYVTGPYNYAAKNQIMLQGSGRYSHFPERARAVKVVATFGQTNTVPLDIQLAATQLIGSIFTNPQDSMKTGETLGDYSIQFGSIPETSEKLGVTTILDQYRDIDI